MDLHESRLGDRLFPNIKLNCSTNCLRLSICLLLHAKVTIQYGVMGMRLAFSRELWEEREGLKACWCDGRRHLILFRHLSKLGVDGSSVPDDEATRENCEVERSEGMMQGARDRK